MKVIGIVGSPRKNGNTRLLTAHCLAAIKEEGISTEIIHLAGKDIKPCTGCMKCQKKEACPIKDDVFPIYLKMKEADGIILASPVYFSSVTALMKALMERAGFLSRNNGLPFAGKVGGSLVVARRTGHNFTLSQLNLWFQIQKMIVPGSSYWNMAFGKEIGEVLKDEEGMTTVWNFGKQVADTLEKLIQ